MKLKRKKVLENLLEYVLSNSGVIIGSPGVGKSYLIREELLLLLESKEINTLYLPIDQLGDGTEEELKQELEYDGTFIDWIYRWSKLSTDNKSTIIFDSLDSARDEIKRKNFLKIIQKIALNYSNFINVLVVVRLFDAKKSPELLNLFKKNKNETIENTYQSNFDCRHFIIPVLDDSDIEEAKNQIKGLSKVIKNTSIEFNELIKIPFNLWLLEKILSSSESFVDLSFIRSEVQLLNMFWEKRVIGKNDREIKELFLKKLTDRMVNQKKLTVNIEEVYDQGIQSIWNELFSDEILIRVSLNEQKVTYSHNILFDYSVNALLIEDDKKELEKFLLGDFSRPLFLRPSLVYFFTNLWYENNKLFWEIFWYLLSSKTSNINLFARLIPTNVIINELRTLKDIQPLFERLTNDEESAIEAFKRILQTFKVNKNKKHEVWSEILSKLSKIIKETFLWELSVSTSEILEYGIVNENNNIIVNCGNSARNIIQWIWTNRTTNKPWIDHVGSRFCIPMICKTFYTNIEESSKLLEKIISLVNEENFPIDYFFMFSNDIDKIWIYDSNLVKSFYEIVFETKIMDETPTNIGPPILPLISNRRQDFQICHYVLEQKFDGFVKIDPIKSGIVAIKIANEFAIREHILPYLKKDVVFETIKEKILFHQKKCTFINDHSYIWSSSNYEEEYHYELKIFNKYLKLIPNIILSGQSVDSFIELYTSYAEAAYIWGKLLLLGCEHTNLFYKTLFEIIKNDSILFSNDTTFQVGEFLKSIYGLISNEQILELEKIILNYNPNFEDNKEWLIKRKAILISLLPTDKISDESKELLKIFEEKKKSLDNKPMATFSSGWVEEEEVDRWEDFGADMSKEGNRKLKAINISLNNFISKWQNVQPDKDAIDNFIPSLITYYSQIKTIIDADDVIIDSVWAKIAESTKIILKSLSLLNSDNYQILKEIIINCAYEKSPLPNIIESKVYDFPSWSPSPRTEAATVLPWLFANKNDKEFLIAIESLVLDKVPSVRFLVVRELWRISELSSDLYWNLIDKLLISETNIVVNSAILTSLSHSLYRDIQNTSTRLIQLIPKGFQSKTDSEFFDSSAGLLVRLIVQYNIDSANQLLIKYLEKPFKYSKVLEKITFNAMLLIDIKYLTSESQKKYFLNAINLLKKLIAVAEVGLTEFLSKTIEERKLLQEVFHDIYGIIHEIVTRIYYHSEMPKEKLMNPQIEIDDKIRNKYYTETLVLLNDILTIISQEKKEILFAPTAHHFIEYLNGVLKYDPINVLRMAYIVSHASKNYNYNLDPMAIKEITKLVERVLSDYRDQFQDENNLQYLVGLLDIFADTGWPEALDLVWRLDEIYK